MASALLASKDHKSLPPLFHQTNSSRNVRLCAVTIDLGQRKATTLLRSHTGLSAGNSHSASQPHLRVLAKPLTKHPSHCHAAWSEN